MKSALSIMFFTVSLCFYSFADDLVFELYSSNPPPETLIDNARERAMTSNKLIVIVFGADWCSDCRKLDSLMSEQGVEAFFAENFELIYVDIGRWDKNLDIVTQFENPIADGIPSMVLTDPRLSAFKSLNGREVARAKKKGGKLFAKWIDRHRLSFTPSI